jgi:hypothetical protein
MFRNDRSNLVPVIATILALGMSDALFAKETKVVGGKGVDAEKPDKTEPIVKLDRQTGGLTERPTYVMRKPQVIAVRTDRAGNAMLRIDVHFADEALIALDEIADAVASISLGKEDPGAKTKLFELEKENGVKKFAALPSALELDIPLGHAVFTIFDPDREYTLVVSRMYVPGIDLSKDGSAKAGGFMLDIRGEPGQVRVWYVLPAPDVVVCYAGRGIIARAAQFRLDAIEGLIEEDAETAGSTQAGKWSAHGLPIFTGVEVGFDNGGELNVLVQALLGSG